MRATMITPNMSSRGKQLAALLGLVIVFALPKSVECGYPGGTCKRPGSFGRTCVDKELEPFGFYVIELIAKTDVGFAYSSSEHCR
jgi:hypothetical protein